MTVNDEEQDLADWGEGVDPDTIELGPDAVAIDLSDGPLPIIQPGTSVDDGRYGFATVVIVALTSLLVGAAITWLWSDDDPAAAAVDVGFAQDMIDHHDQAVELALIALGRPNIDPVVRSFATEVLLFQRWEIGIMDAYLEDWGRPRGDPTRLSMTWMGMGTPLQAMPGMQSDDELAALAAAEGSDADRLFLTMMREHHEGGVHMAEFAADEAEDSRTRTLAARMARNQRIEVDEYTVTIERLGLAE